MIEVSIRYVSANTFYRRMCREYASLLQAKLPAAQAATGQQHRLVDGGESMVCYVVNTAEYCADILPQLEEMIK